MMPHPERVTVWPWQWPWAPQARYLDDSGKKTQVYPLNPNGSPDAIVGLCSQYGRHLAMMPHPERVTVWPWQWPWAPQAWMEGPSRLKASPWLRMFQNARAWCDAANGGA